MDPKLNRILVTVVIMVEVCVEGNWLIQASASFYPSLSKEYNTVYLMLKMLSRCNGKLVLVENKRKNAN